MDILGGVFCSHLTSECHTPSLECCAIQEFGMILWALNIFHTSPFVFPYSWVLLPSLPPGCHLAVIERLIRLLIFSGVVMWKIIWSWTLLSCHDLFHCMSQTSLLIQSSKIQICLHPLESLDQLDIPYFNTTFVIATTTVISSISDASVLFPRSCSCLEFSDSEDGRWNHFLWMPMQWSDLQSVLLKEICIHQ